MARVGELSGFTPEPLEATVSGLDITAFRIPW
jgi:hypothetical protein